MWYHAAGFDVRREEVGYRNAPMKSVKRYVTFSRRSDDGMLSLEIFDER